MYFADTMLQATIQHSIRQFHGTFHRCYKIKVNQKQYNQLNGTSCHNHSEIFFSKVTSTRGNNCGQGSSKKNYIKSYPMICEYRAYEASYLFLMRLECLVQ